MTEHEREEGKKSFRLYSLLPSNASWEHEQRAQYSLGDIESDYERLLKPEMAKKLKEAR